MMFSDAAWQRRPLRTTVRVAVSLLRRRLAPFRETSVPYDGGRSRIIANLGTALGLRLYRYGIRDADLALTGVLLSKGDTFIDGGANIGLFTLVAASRVGPTGHVFAFEPAPPTASLLRQNVALNRFGAVRVVEAALGATKATTKFTSFTGEGAGLSSFAPAVSVGGVRVDVAVTTLDDAIDSNCLPTLRLVKLDLEGAECAALQGAARLLEHHAPDLLVEVEEAHLTRQGASVEQLDELLRPRGYRFFEPCLDEAGRLVLRTCESPSSPRRSANVFATRNVARVRACGVQIGTWPNR
jgi:FkbM family methyltransferase